MNTLKKNDMKASSFYEINVLNITLVENPCIMENISAIPETRKKESHVQVKCEFSNSLTILIQAQTPDTIREIGTLS